MKVLATALPALLLIPSASAGYLRPRQAAAGAAKYNVAYARDVHAEEPEFRIRGIDFRKRSNPTKCTTTTTAPANVPNECYGDYCGPETTITAPEPTDEPQGECGDGPGQQPCPVTTTPCTTTTAAQVTEEPNTATCGGDYQPACPEEPTTSTEVPAGETCGVEGKPECEPTGINTYTSVEPTTTETSPQPTCGVEGKPECEPVPTCGVEGTPECEPAPTCGGDYQPACPTTTNGENPNGSTGVPSPTETCGVEGKPECQPEPTCGVEGKPECEPQPTCGVEDTPECEPAPTCGGAYQPACPTGIPNSTTTEPTPTETCGVEGKPECGPQPTCGVEGTPECEPAPTCGGDYLPPCTTTVDSGNPNGSTDVSITTTTYVTVPCRTCEETTITATIPCTNTEVPDAEETCGVEGKPECEPTGINTYTSVEPTTTETSPEPTCGVEGTPECEPTGINTYTSATTEVPPEPTCGVEGKPECQPPSYQTTEPPNNGNGETTEVPVSYTTTTLTTKECESCEPRTIVTTVPCSNVPEPTCGVEGKPECNPQGPPAQTTEPPADYTEPPSNGNGETLTGNLCGGVNQPDCAPTGTEYVPPTEETEPPKPTCGVEGAPECSPGEQYSSTTITSDITTTIQSFSTVYNTLVCGGDSGVPCPTSPPEGTPTYIPPSPNCGGDTGVPCPEETTTPSCGGDTGIPCPEETVVEPPPYVPTTLQTCPPGGCGVPTGSPNTTQPPQPIFTGAGSKLEASFGVFIGGLFAIVMMF